MFLLLPAINLIKGSFTDMNGNFVGLSNYYAVVTRRYYQISIINSLNISIISSIAGLIVGLLTSYVLLRITERSKNLLLIFTNVTSNFAGIPLAFGYIILLGTNGIITMFLLKKLGIDLYQNFSLYSVTGIAIAYLYFQIPLATLLIFPSFFAIKKEWQEASLSLGASEFYFWRKVGIPILTPGIIATFVILFANALGAYVTPQALTNGTFNIITLRLAHFLTSEVNPDYNKADALAVILGVLLVFSLVINLKMNKRSQLWQK
jgi:putative spermidine/putrescine transport system permease protein